MISNADFYRLFLVREGKELAGKRMVKLTWLFIILLITFLAIGFGEGGLKYLEIKMSDPFVNWVNIPIPSEKNYEARSLLSKLDNDSIKNHFLYRRVSSYTHYSQDFFDKKGGEIPAEGRTIETHSPLLERILSPEFKIAGISNEEIEEYFSGNKLGLIVCKELLIKLGYDDFPPYISMRYPLSNDTDLVVPLPVIAVVKQLPGMISLMAPPLFYQEITNPVNYSFNISDPSYQNYLRYFLPAGHNPEEWKSRIESILISRWPGIISSSISEPNYESFIRGATLHFELDTSYIRRAVSANHIADHLALSLGQTENPLTRIYDYKFGRIYTGKISTDYFSVYFSNLDSVAAFQRFMEKDLRLKIDLAQIDAKENFNLISKLTLITSFFLIIFSIMSVSMFLTNLIRSHFDRIKRNIGTFKAFGLDNRRLITTYSLISFSFVLFSSITAYLVAYLLGSAGFIKLILQILQINLERGHSYFDLNNWKTFFAFVVVILLSTIIVVIRLKGMLSHTPGDLIYERK